MLLLPIYFFCRVSGREIGRRSVRRYTSILVVLATLLLVTRVSKVWNDWNHTGQNPTHFSFTEPTRTLQQEIPRHAVLVTPCPNLAGNLRVHLPDAYCCATRLACFQPAQASGRKCYVLLWQPEDEDGADQSQTLVEIAQQRSGVALQTRGKPRCLEIPPLCPNGRSRPIRVAYIVAYRDEL